MITASTPKTEKNQILQNLKILADRRVGAVDSELKLLYVTVCVELVFMTLRNTYFGLFTARKDEQG